MATQSKQQIFNAVSRLIALLFLLAATGCSTLYEDTDHAPYVSQLIGLRCQLIKAEAFTEADRFSTFGLGNPFENTVSRPVNLDAGTVLCVTHTQNWQARSASGTLVFARAESGRVAGHSFLIGTYGYPGGDVLGDTVIVSSVDILCSASLAPCTAEDEGWFYGPDAPGDTAYHELRRPADP
jgi:hypothetical protein